MKKVTYFACRMSHFGFRALGCYLLTVLVGISLTGQTQTLNYSFHKGEVIDYDMIQKRYYINGDNNNNPETTWKYQFRVDDVHGETYDLTMKLIGYYSGYLWVSNRTAVPDYQKTLTGERRNLFNILFDIEINHPISFTINSGGVILKIDGVDSLFNAVVKEADRNPDIKRTFDYNQIKVRYSGEYYKFLFREFFPAIPASLSDTVCLKSGKSCISVINAWSSVRRIADSIQPMRPIRSYLFNIDFKYKVGFPGKNLTGEMLLYWPTTSGFPTRINYKGYTPEDLAFEVSLNGILSNVGYAGIEIVNTNRSATRSKTVSINGNISDVGENSFIAYLPGNEISKQKLPVELKPDGSFSIDFDTDVPSGLVEIYYYTGSMAYLWNSPGNPNQIRIFVKQGDSVHFSVSLKEPKKIDFRGSSKNDQVALNKMSCYFPPGDPELSMQTTRDNINLLKKQNSLLSPEFQRFMEIENRYTLLSHQVEEFSRIGFGKNLNPIDSLPQFIKYLGFSDGYKSDAYKEFICDLLQSYGSLKILKIFGYAEGTRDFDFSTAILGGWDLYWHQALNAEARLEKFPYDDYDQLYLQFADRYPGTEFQNKLYQKYRLTEKARIGAEIPDLNFEDLNGKRYSTRDFKGHNWVLINARYSTGSYKSLVEDLKLLMDNYLPGSKVLIAFPWFYPNFSAEERSKLLRDLKGQARIIVRNPAGNDAFGKYMRQLPTEEYAINGNNRIAAYGRDRWMGILTYGTWPQLSPPPSETISLTVFWYSLGGAFILSLIIVLTIRIRSKRKENRLTLKRKMAQLEVDAVRSRMNPHFLFNALSSIQNLINKKQIEEANLYLARFGDLVRTILMQSSKPAIGLNEEIDMIRNYLQLEQLRFPFVFDIRIDPLLDLFAIEVPPLLIQPHVENAVVHGVSGLGKEGRIDISFRQENKHLVCEVKDNGPGYHPGLHSTNGGLGQGWKLTRQRIELMKKQYGDDVSVEVPVPDPEIPGAMETSGTTVIFKLPIQLPS